MCKTHCGEWFTGAGTVRGRESRLKSPKSIRGERTPQAVTSECTDSSSCTLYKFVREVVEPRQPWRLSNIAKVVKVIQGSVNLGLTLKIKRTKQAPVLVGFTAIYIYG